MEGLNGNNLFSAGERASGPEHLCPLPEALSLIIMHLTNAELYNILAINKQWFSIVIRHLWRAVHVIDFMKITERGRQRVASSIRRRGWESSGDEEENSEEHPNRNKPTSVKHLVSSEDARRLAIYSSNIVTLRLDDPQSYFASSYKVIREFSRMIDGWCETICELASTDPSLWPAGVTAPPRGFRIKKSQISSTNLFPKLSCTSWRYETHWERMDFDVPLNPVHGLLQLPLMMDLQMYEQVEYAARNSSRICFTNAVAIRGCGEIATQRLVQNLRGNSNLRDLEICCSRHSRIVHPGRWIAFGRNTERRAQHTSEGGSDGDGVDEDDSDGGSLNQTEEDWESNLERLILRSNYPQHLLLLLLHPSFLGQLQKLRYLHLHSTLKNKPPRPPRGSSSSGDESDEEDPPLSFNWVTHPKYGAGNYNTNSLSRRRARMAPLYRLFEGVTMEIVRSPSDSTTEPTPPPPPQAVIHIKLPLLQFIAMFFPQLEMLVLEGLWNVESLTRLESIPSTLDLPHVIAAGCLPVSLRIPVDFKRNTEVQDRIQGLVLAIKRGLKQTEVLSSHNQKSGPPSSSPSVLKRSPAPVKWWRKFFKR